MAKPKAQTLQQRFGFADKDLTTPKHDEIMLWLDENCISVVEQLFWELDWGKDEIRKFTERTNEAVVWAKSLYASLISKANEDIEKYNSSSAAEYEKLRLERACNRKSNSEWLLSKFVNWTGLGDVPPKPRLHEMVHGTEWEVPVTSKNYKSTYTIGFVDFVFRYSKPKLYVEGIYKEDGWVLVENATPRWRVKVDQHTLPIYFEVKTTIPSLGELIRQIQMYRQHAEGKWVVICPDDRFAEPLLRQGIYLYKYDPALSITDEVIAPDGTIYQVPV